MAEALVGNDGNKNFGLTEIMWSGEFPLRHTGSINRQEYTKRLKNDPRRMWQRQKKKVESMKTFVRMEG